MDQAYLCAVLRSSPQNPHASKVSTNACVSRHRDSAHDPFVDDIHALDSVVRFEPFGIRENLFYAPRHAHRSRDGREPVHDLRVRVPPQWGVGLWEWGNLRLAPRPR